MIKAKLEAIIQEERKKLFELVLKRHNEGQHLIDREILVQSFILTDLLNQRMEVQE